MICKSEIQFATTTTTSRHRAEHAESLSQLLEEFSHVANIRQKENILCFDVCIYTCNCITHFSATLAHIHILLFTSLPILSFSLSSLHFCQLIHFCFASLHRGYVHTAHETELCQIIFKSNITSVRSNLQYLLTLNETESFVRYFDTMWWRCIVTALLYLTIILIHSYVFWIWIE